MCGIFGWIGAPPDDCTALAARVHALLEHRGPNDKGYVCDADWGLVFRRLSILDLSALGHQPMSAHDKRYWLVFNGEIYNYIELRETLIAAGEQFTSQSDSEVLLRLLIRDGANAINKLNGQFAFAFIDTVERTFLLARDRMGQKPLYYCQSHGHLRFGSELKALLAWPNASRELNMSAVAEYLGLMYVAGEQAIFADYAKVPAGHYLAGSLNEPHHARLHQYWQLHINGDNAPATLKPSQQEQLADLLQDAIKLRLRSDVPVGIFLSGGVDSGLIATLASQISDTPNLLALTVGFEEEAFDESEYASRVAEQAGLEHRIVNVSSQGLAYIDKLAWYFDEPFGDPSALPTMLLCEAAAEHATVFLSGDGGDEAFGGYARYIKAQNLTWLGHIPSPLQAGLQSVARLMSPLSPLRYKLTKSSLPNAGFAAVFDDMPEDPLVGLTLKRDYHHYVANAGRPIWERWQKTATTRSLLARQQQLDYGLYLPDDVLVKVDRASMAHSLEVRSPLLDHRLVEWAARLPRQTLIESGVGKIPLRSLAKRLLPAAVQQGKKRGFNMPIGHWLRAEKGQEFARQRLMSADSPLRDILNQDGIGQMLASHKTGNQQDLGHWLWRLLMLDAWARHYRHAKVPVI